MTKFLVELKFASGNDNTQAFQALVQMQVRELLGSIIPTKPHGAEGGPTRVLVVTADREQNEAAEIALGLFALPGVTSARSREVVPLLRRQPVRAHKLPGRNRG